MNYRKDLDKTLDFIEKYISDELTLEQISANIGYSPFHFSRIFIFIRAFYGQHFPSK